MRIGRVELSLLDPNIFTAKMAMLIVFMGAFVPLKAWDLQVPLLAYTTFILVLHVWLVAIYIWRVRWRLLWLNKPIFGVRVFSVAFFVFLLTRLSAGATIAELVAFLLLSLGVHTALLLVLMVRVEPLGRAAGVAAK